MELQNDVECGENSISKEELVYSRKRKNPFNTQRLKEEKERRQKKRARLIVRNISYKSTDQDLRKHFEQWGKVEEVCILKRSDGKLVGCAFVQFETVNQATKAIIKGNSKDLLGRPLFIDWALGKDEYETKVRKNLVPKKENPEISIKENEVANDSVQLKEHIEKTCNKNDEDVKSDDDNSYNDTTDSKQILDTPSVKLENHKSNDLLDGCTVFIKNVPFDAEDADLRKVCRKFGILHYAIINREKISGHSKGTAFVKFKTKESADLCLQAGTEFTLMNEVLEPRPALSREEIQKQITEKSKDESRKDSRNLYLTREGLIMAHSKAAEGVSASDMAKRHQLEKIKTQVLKDLNRFVSRNRLSIHNLPLNYDNENLKQMATANTGFKPHECRVMRENKVTPEHPQGKSKGFGFLSFNTHQEALTALRKLNNNPSIFGIQHRPIVAFSIEDRGVHKNKQKRDTYSKINNPTYKEKMQKRKEKRKLKVSAKLGKLDSQEDKSKLQKNIKELELKRENEGKSKQLIGKTDEFVENYVGTAAKPGSSIRMRSTKKIAEQALEHLKRVKNEKRKKKLKKINILSEESKSKKHLKQNSKVEKDTLQPLVNKYKMMIERNANVADRHSGVITGKVRKRKLTKWFTE